MRVLGLLRVAWVNERQERGLSRDHACRILGLSPHTYTRWRSILRRDGVRALADHRTPTRRRDPWKRREVREAVEHVRLQPPCGKDKLAILLARQGVTVSASAEGFLRECLERWPDRIRSIQVDNGSEFRGDFEHACAKLQLELVTIPPSRPQRNGCVERLQRTFRDEHYAYEPASLDLHGANTHLDAYLHYYNHDRPHHALKLKTPMEYAHPRNPQRTGHKT